jgi:hypothetical protein
MLAPTRYSKGMVMDNNRGDVVGVVTLSESIITRHMRWRNHMNNTNGLHIMQQSL